MMTGTASMVMTAGHRQLHTDWLRLLYDELAFALLRTDAATLREWGGQSARTFVVLTGRRAGALFSLAKRLGRAGVEEVKGVFVAGREHRAGQHLGDRTAAAIDGTIDFVQGGKRLLAEVGHALKEDPRTNAPKVLAAFLGFYAGSGGVDGDGGIPDLDLLAGIDAHRSLLTHSILAGVLAEGVLLALVDLAGRIHDRLPVDHDPLWDKLAEASAPLTGALTAGASAGIAYHLLWDASIEPAPYHGLPVEMTMEAHQAVMGANGVAEAAYVANKSRGHSGRIIDQCAPERPSTGRKFVDAIGNGVSVIGQAGRGFIDGLKGK